MVNCIAGYFCVTNFEDAIRIFVFIPPYHKGAGIAPVYVSCSLDHAFTWECVAGLQNTKSNCTDDYKSPGGCKASNQNTRFLQVAMYVQQFKVKIFNVAFRIFTISSNVHFGI